MSEPVIRRATPDDAPALAAIGAATFTETFGHLYPPQDLTAFLAEAYDLAATRRNLADPEKAAWLVEADGDVIGYAEVGPCGLPHPEVTEASGELKRFYFRKAWQNRGLGTKLLHLLLDIARKENLVKIIGYVLPENIEMQRICQALGFVAEERDDVVRVELEL